MHFSVKQAVLLITCLSVYFGLLALLNSELEFFAISSAVLLCGIPMVMPSLAVIGIIYAKGYHRAMWIGAALPCLFSGVVGFFLFAEMINGLLYYNSNRIGSSETVSLVSLHAVPLIAALCSGELYRLYTGRKGIDASRQTPSSSAARAEGGVKSGE